MAESSDPLRDSVNLILRAMDGTGEAGATPRELYQLVVGIAEQPFQFEDAIQYLLDAGHLERFSAPGGPYLRLTLTGEAMALAIPHQ